MKRIIPFNRALIFLLLIITISAMVSCQRKAIHKEHPEFIGDWVHHDTNGEHWYIDISDKSWGTITVYDSDFKDLMRFGENPHRWRYNEKKKKLTLRLIPDSFDVTQLPSTADSLIIIDFDTIPEGSVFCVLDGKYYLKQE